MLMARSKGSAISDSSLNFNAPGAAYPMSGKKVKRKKHNKKKNKKELECKMAPRRDLIFQPSIEECKDEDEDEDDAMDLDSLQSPPTASLQSFQQSAKPAPARQSAITTSSSSVVDYQPLVSSQDPSGYFTTLPKQYNLDTSIVPTDLKNMLKDDKNATKIWITIIVLLLLDRDCKPSQGEWKMIAKKAKTYLKKQGVKDYKVFSIPTTTS